MKPKVCFARDGRSVTIHLPYEDEEGLGALTIGGFGFNPVSALRKAAAAAKSLLENDMIAPFLPPQAQLVIKTAAALTSLDKNELEAVARDQEAAPSARKLASVLGDVGAPSWTWPPPPRRAKGKGKRYVPRSRTHNRRPGGYPDQSQQYGQDPYGQPMDPYGQPMDPYGQQFDPYGNPINPYGQQQPQPQLPPQPYYPGFDPYGQPPQPYYGQPAYGAPAYAMPAPQYYQYPQQAQAPSFDPYQDAAEQIWGANAFAAQDEDQAQYMADAGEDVDDDLAGDAEMAPGCAFDPEV